MLVQHESGNIRLMEPVTPATLDPEQVEAQERELREALDDLDTWWRW